MKKFRNVSSIRVKNPDGKSIFSQNSLGGRSMFLGQWFQRGTQIILCLIITNYLLLFFRKKVINNFSPLWGGGGRVVFGAGQLTSLNFIVSYLAGFIRQQSSKSTLPFGGF